MSTSHPNILIVTSEFPPQPGGIGNHAYNLALQLSRNGYEVTVITDQRSDDGKEELHFDAVLPFHVKRTRIFSPRFLMYFIRLRRLFDLSHQSEIVIASGKFSLWGVALLSLFRRKYYLVVTHGTEVNFKAFFPRMMTNWSLKRFDDVIAVSNYTKQLMAHLKLRSITVIPNGYDPVKWQKDILPGKLLGYPKLITVGNVTERKGQGNVITLLPELVKGFPNLHYHCVGIPTEVDRFITLAQRLGVEKHVTFHGRLNDDELQSMLMDADVFVMFSGETASGDVEGFGIALIEANALGIPVIAASGSGVEEAVSHGKSGFLVESNDFNAFEESLKLLIREKQWFSKQSVHWAIKFKWDLVIKQYITLIEKVS